MTTLKGLPEDKRVAVLDRAIVLLEEREKSADSEAWIAAAEELGIPRDILEEAALAVRKDVVEQQVQRAHSLRRYAFVGLGLVAAIVVGLMLFPPGPGRHVYDFDEGAGGQWSLYKNPETKATLSFLSQSGRGRVAQLNVGNLVAARSDGKYLVNLRTEHVPRSFKRFETVSIEVRGEGLESLRIYLRRNETQRWRSEKIPVTTTWTGHTLSLDSFAYQERAGKYSDWLPHSWRSMDTVQMIQLKVGDGVNDIDAAGTVEVDNLIFGRSRVEP